MTNTKEFNNNVHTKDINLFNESDAVELALLIERQEQSLNLMKAKLKAYVNLNGAVNTNAKTWGFVPALKWEFTENGTAELAAMLTIDGVNPYQFLKLGANDIKKLLQAGYTEDFLKQFGSKVPTNPTFKSVAKVVK